MASAEDGGISVRIRKRHYVFLSFKLCSVNLNYSHAGGKAGNSCWALDASLNLKIKG